MSTITIKNVSAAPIVLPPSLLPNPGYMQPWPNLAGGTLVIVQPGDTIVVDADQWRMWTAGNEAVANANNGAGFQVIG